MTNKVDYTDKLISTEDISDFINICLSSETNGNIRKDLYFNSAGIEDLDMDYRVSIRIEVDKT